MKETTNGNMLGAARSSVPVASVAQGCAVLPKSAEDALIARALTDAGAMGEIVQRYAPLVRRAVRERYLTAVAPREELEGIASLALIEAVRAYDASAGVHFAGFAARRVHDALYAEFRRARREWERTSRPDQSDNAAAFWETHGDEVDEGATPAAQTERRALIAQATAILSPEEKRLLELIYYAELPLRQIAPLVHKSHQALAQAKKRLLKKMRAALTAPPLPTTTPLPAY